MHGVQQQDQGLVGEAAAKLPWLCPSADALIQLTNEPTPVSELSGDAGLVLLALRYARPTTTVDEFRFESLRESVVAEAASRLLEKHSLNWLNPTHPVAARLRAYSHHLAQSARQVAEQNGRVNPEAAEAVGLLAAMGWWAVAAVQPQDAERCWVESRSSEDQCSIQKKHWGLSQEDVTRRLCSRWRLPPWLSTCLTTLSLSVGDAVRCGAHPELTQVLRDAVEQLETQSRFAGWLKPAACAKSLEESSAPEVDRVSSEDPRTIRLLPQLLRSAARTRRVSNEHRLRAAEEEVDQLHRLLADLRDGFEIAVRDAKLAGLAELAAGASHEINNPLAVIAGHAQRLRKAETDPDRRKSLEAISRQTNRISEIVRDLMQYARPATPNRTAVNFHELIALSIAAFQPQAAVKGIRLSCELDTDSAGGFLDYVQVRKTIDAVLQNAIEATPSGGEIRITQHANAERTTIRVEDTGSGPSDAAVPHLFDPFFSGRTAGRGRGLGLATAWRLASINGGELHYRPGPAGVTRFELVFPKMEIAVPTLRKPA